MGLNHGPISGPILGIDPGSHLTGYGVVTERGGNPQCLAFGVLEGEQDALLPQRLYKIGEGLREIIRQYSPSAMVIEKTFYAKNADSASKLGHARGVCIYEG